MNYYFKKEIEGDFNDAINKITEELQKAGFGVITDIDVKATMKKKLDVDFREYRILGACNPKLAKEALEMDEQAGALLPCNVVVQQKGNGKILVSSINPQALLGISKKKNFDRFAAEISKNLQRVLANL